MARSTNLRTKEWGSKARKAEGRNLKNADAKAAIAEALLEAAEEVGTVVLVRMHEFEGVIFCNRCALHMSHHEFGPWDYYYEDIDLEGVMK